MFLGKKKIFKTSLHDKNANFIQYSIIVMRVYAYFSEYVYTHITEIVVIIPKLGRV